MSAKIYPAVQTGERCADYRVFVNGKEVPLQTARVSAYPFNRRWPGHQREKEQTELVNFVSFAVCGETEIVVRPKDGFSCVHIRPRRLPAESWVGADGSVTVRLREPAYFTVEPYGTRRALHIFADPMPSYNVRPGSGVLYFGAGEHDAGTIELHSGQTLYLEEGAVVYATVFARDAKNIRILGRGILDNRKNTEKILFEANARGNSTDCGNAVREHAITLVGCENAEIDGITVRDSLLYNIDCVSCKNVHIRAVKVIGCWRYNSDGVHFACCENCSLTDSFLRTYDDAVCVRGYSKYEYERWLTNRTGNLPSTKNIRVSGCTIWNDWGKGLQIGTETYAEEIADVIFENCKIVRVSFGPLYMWLVDNAKVHDVVFRGIDIEFDEYNCPPRIQQADGEVYRYEYDAEFSCPFIAFLIEKHFEYSMIQREEELGSISGVLLEDIRFYSVQKPFFLFAGQNENSRCERVACRRLYWNGERIPRALFERQAQCNEFCSQIVLEE